MVTLSYLGLGDMGRMQCTCSQLYNKRIIFQRAMMLQDVVFLSRGAWGASDIVRRKGAKEAQKEDSYDNEMASKVRGNVPSPKSALYVI